MAYLFIIAAFLICALAPVAFFRDTNAPGRRVFCLGLLLLGSQAFLSARIYNSTTSLEAFFWRAWWFLPQSIAPAVWLLFTLKYSRGNYQQSIRKWLPFLGFVTLVPLLCLTLFGDSLFVLRGSETEGWGFELGFSGYFVYLSIVLSSALILINLERTFRAAVGTLRWRVKFLILGTAAIFIANLYTASQVLLFKAHTFNFDIIGSVALMVAALLFLRGLVRGGIFHVQVYPSEQVLQFSVAGLLIGAYLVAIGLGSKLVAGWSGPEAFAFRAFLLLASLAMLGILLVSERLRDRFKRAISHHFHRPFFDYRTLWLSFTEKTTSIVDPDALSRTVVNWISEQLHVQSTSVWLVDPESRNIRVAASTGISSNYSLAANDSSELVAALQKEAGPFDIDTRNDGWITTLKRCYPDNFRLGANRVCVPLNAAGRLVGFCTLGDRVNNIPLAFQEFELLKCVGDQVASALLNLELSSRLIQAKEMEAFQTISAFFVHDLKNTASTLNLTLQNLPKHFDNPDFRKDALRSIGKSVTHIQELISRLTFFRQTIDLHRSKVDLNTVAQRCIDNLKDASLPLTTRLSDVQPVSADPEQLQTVIVNLLLNARDALKENGRIELSTSQQSGFSVISVSDNGCGMSAEFLSRSLFRPFKTTKKGGIGIGMFQSKAIIDAHGGKLDVESEPGRGTTFRIFLPTLGIVFLCVLCVSLSSLCNSSLS